MNLETLRKSKDGLFFNENILIKYLGFYNKIDFYSNDIQTLLRKIFDKAKDFNLKKNCISKNHLKILNNTN